MNLKERKKFEELKRENTLLKEKLGYKADDSGLKEEYKMIFHVRSGKKVVVNFTEKLEFEHMKKQRKKYNILVSLLLTFVIVTLLFFIQFLFAGFNIWVLIGSAVIAFVLYKIFEGYGKQYDQERYAAIIYYLKRNYRIAHENSKTGTISYIKDGVRETISVFKGYNSKYK